MQQLCGCLDAFTREQIGSQKIEILTSGTPEVVNNAADTPGSLTGILSENLEGFLKASPRGFPSYRLHRELSRRSPNNSELIDLSHENHKKIWLCPLVSSRQPPQVEATDDIFLNLKLRLRDKHIDVSMMNEIALHTQSLPHVSEIKFEDLAAPKEEITNFMVSVLRANKLGPLMRKLYARRELWKLKELSKNGGLTQSQPRLLSDPGHHIRYDRLNAMETYSHRSGEHLVSPPSTPHYKKRRLSY